MAAADNESCLFLVNHELSKKKGQPSEIYLDRATYINKSLFVVYLKDKLVLLKIICNELPKQKNNKYLTFIILFIL